MDSPVQLPEPDSPPTKIAASLGCDKKSSVWMNTMETSTTTNTIIRKEKKDMEQLNTVEREALMPTGKILDIEDRMVKRSWSVTSQIRPVILWRVRQGSR